MSTRRKGLLGTFGALLVVSALVVFVSLAEPEEACAGDCEFGWTNANAWGMGATCAAAKTSCESNAISTADGECASINKDLCDTGAITYNSCYPAGGQIKVDCVLQYKCEGGPEFPFP